MGSSSEVVRAAVVYRNLMKAIKEHIGKEKPKSHFTDFISQEFRKKCEKLDSVQQKLKLARDYTVLLNSVHHHKMYLCSVYTLIEPKKVPSDYEELLFSYNIAVDRSDEMQKVLGKSAASVGLQLPQVYQS